MTTTTTIASRPPRALLRRRAPRAFVPPRARLLLVALFLAFCSVLFLVFFANENQRAVFAPMLSSVNLAAFFFAVLYARDGEVPAFESGSLCVAATAMYSAYPLFNFVMNGMRWQPPSDWRLIVWDPTPQQLGAYAWNHVLYLGTFAVVYLIVRGGRRVPRVFTPVPAAVQSAVIVTFAVVLVLVEMVRFIALPPEASISPYEGGNFAYRANVPLIFLQFLNIGTNALLALKILFAILLLSRWRERKWRIIMLLWLPVEFVLITITYSRSPFVMLLLTIGIAYHRMVKPFTLRLAFFASIALIAGFLGFGLVRDTRGDSIDLRTALVVNNEFQGIFANGYDIKMRKQFRILPAPPPQMAWSELYSIIPSQVLPFEKVEPSEWYAEVLGITHTGLRVVFGVMAKSMLGRGTFEVFLRGAAIAVILALIHRWYVRRADRFWPTALYAYISIWTFYTFRSATLAPLYFVVYYFGTAVFLVTAVRFALSGRRRLTDALRR